MNIRWISTLVLIVTFLAIQGVGYGEEEQPCLPDAVVMFGNIAYLSLGQKHRDAFGIVLVANPDSSLAGGGLCMTIGEDGINWPLAYKNSV
ncbi:MAG: hypothetical protein MRK02_11355 [Candidatus Scalindua sp.]|nr:hypothetical protein [Candidatus Scalindua sp.]